MESRSLRSLVGGLIDYAGLFPPAKLGMADAVKAFARHRAGPHAYGLARFVCPMARLDEWARCAEPLLAGRSPAEDQAPPDPWRISVLIDGNLGDELEAIARFNQSHEVTNGATHKHAHTALIDTIELKVQTPEIIDQAIDHLPEDLFPFFEVPADCDFRGFATALAGTGYAAKFRAGGITQEMFPPIERIADFLVAFNAAEVAFKATAGLHHPFRGSYALTYEPGSACGTMNGFVNLFLGAALLRELEIDRATLIRVLSESSPDAFRFEESGAAWRDLHLSTEQIENARENFAICFGSCSYDDPINDLARLGLIVPDLEPGAAH